MKISKSALALSGAVLGLGLVYCEQGTNCVPTKAQLILRQKIDQLNGTSVSRSQTQQLADAERLHKEGTIDDQQFEALKKEINEQYAAAASGANPEASAKAQQALEKKISDLNSRSRNLDAAQAQKKAAHPVTSAVSQEVVQQKIAESRTAQKVNAVPAPAGGTLAPESEAKAREILRTK